MLKKYCIFLNLIIINILVSTTFVNAQVSIKKHKDVMDGLEWYAVSTPLKLTNSDKSRGLILNLSINKNLETNGFLCNMWGLGKCTENNNIIFMFADSTKLMRNSLDKFECKGQCYFNINKEWEEVLSIKKIIKIRITNRYNNEQYTKSLFGKDQTYFIDLFKVINLERSKLPQSPKREETLNIIKEEKLKSVNNIETKRTIDTTIVYSSSEVDENPEFPGGYASLNEFLSKNLEYPKDAIKMGISGNVYVSFIIDRDGSLNNIEIKRSVDSMLDAEAIRVVKLMPKWNPCKIEGTNVKVKFDIPIRFNNTY